MNILDSAYRIGQQMKTISIGREWTELYSELSETISPEAWDTFLKIPKELLHYYSFAHALDVIKENSERDDIPFLKDQLLELKASKQLKLLSELSITLGNNLNEMLKSSIAPTPVPKDFGQLQATPKLSRSIQDIHRAFQRSGILKSSLRFMDSKTNEFPNILQEFNHEKSGFPHVMDSRIRKLVCRLGATEEQKKLLNIMYLSDLIFEFTLQMVFEAHLNRVVHIDADSIIRSQVKDVKGIRPVYLNLNESMLSKVINEKGHFITVWLDGALQTAIITKRVVRYGKNLPRGFKVVINGYLYPESDVNLFINL